jgi:ankyrin repeat protein
LLTPEAVNNQLLLHKDIESWTFLHMAVTAAKLDLLRKLWEWIEECLTPEDLNNLFLAKDSIGRTAWHVAANGGYVDILLKTVEVGQKVANAREG